MSSVRGGRLSKNSELFTYFRFEGFWRDAGSVTGQNLFSIDEFNVNVTTETLTKDDNQGPVAEQGAIIPLKTTVEADATFGSMGEFAMRSALNSASSDGYFAQAAIVNQVYSIAAAAQKKGGIYLIPNPVNGLPIQNMSGIEATWGGAAAVEGTDYMVDRRTGTMELLRDPTADSVFALTYDAAAILASKGLLRMGIGSAPGGMRGSMHGLAVNEYGRQVRLDFWNVLATPNGGVSLQATSEFSTTKVKMSLQSAQIFDGKMIPNELRFGQVIQLDDTPLAA
jgi:hypothetical protein